MKKQHKRSRLLAAALSAVLCTGMVPWQAAAEERYYGDANNDGILDVFDLALMKRDFPAGLDAVQQRQLDLNGDGANDAQDIGLMQDFLLKRIDRFPVGSVFTVPEPEPEPEPEAYNGIKKLTGARKMEKLDRGVVAVRSGKSAFISWRLLASDESDIGFNVYRTTGDTTVKLNDAPLTGGTNFTDSTADLNADNTYSVTTVYNGVETPTDGSFTLPAGKGSGAYYTVPIKEGGTVHFVWAGDLNGDGAYDYVIDRNADDHQKLEAYLNDGTYLWTLDLGYNSENKNNISPGASTIDVGMWDGATVYDIDLDGTAEVIVRIADGVVFGDGKKYSNSDKNGQAIAVLDGQTGAMKTTCKLPTDYNSVGPLACMMQVGYLDGKTPSIVCWLKNRNADKSFNSLMVAYHMENGTLTQQWKYDNKKGYAEAHQIRLADVDYDGRDEVLHMGYALNSDGTLRYTVDGVVHGDRWFVGAFSNDNNGKAMMGYGIQQENPSGLLEYFYNASTGKIVWKNATTDGSTYDVGRGSIGDLDPNHDGLECYSFQGMWTMGGKKLTDSYPYPSFRIFWNGDLGSESYNDGKIERWNYETQGVERVDTTWKIYGASGSDRGVGMLHADLIGDWREESVLVNYDTHELVIYTTLIPTEHRIPCLAQDPCYRNCMTGKGYYQSNMLSYFLGYGMEEVRTPDISYIGEVSIDETALYTIRNASSGRVLDVAGGKAANGTNVQQYAKSGGKAANTWNLKSAGDGYFYIYSEVADGKTYLLDVTDGKSDNGTNVHIYEATGSKAQQFRLIPNSDGSYTIAARCANDAKCVEVADASGDAGANVQIFKINGHACQHWYFEAN